MSEGMPTIASLNERFGFDGGVTFHRDTSGLALGKVKTKRCEGAFFLHGAHVSHFQPSSTSAPVLFQSEKAWYEEGKPIRGGIPICFPWFGPHPHDSSLPAHGLARIRPWELKNAKRFDETVELLLTTDFSGWELHYQITFGESLHTGLQVFNRADEERTFEVALHTYFSLANVHEARIRGLEQTPFLNQLTKTEHPATGEPIVFTEETDRIYDGAIRAVAIEDGGNQRVLELLPRHSQSTVVWNPWIAKSKRMPDFGDQEYLSMCCVETANIGKRAVSLKPGESHMTSLEVRVRHRL